MGGTQSAAPNLPIFAKMASGTLEIKMVVLSGCANFTHVDVHTVLEIKQR